jgi:hypothetical protein
MARRRLNAMLRWQLQSKLKLSDGLLPGLECKAQCMRQNFTFRKIHGHGNQLGGLKSHRERLKRRSQRHSLALSVSTRCERFPLSKNSRQILE